MGKKVWFAPTKGMGANSCAQIRELWLKHETKRYKEWYLKFYVSKSSNR